jgi:hypothetical protein
MSPRWGSRPRFADWLTVSRNATLTFWEVSQSIPCGGGVEYLHRSLASRRRRQKGKSLILGNKMWSRVPRDWDPKITALARTSSNCKRQTRPLVRENAQHQQTRNILTIIKIWSRAPDGCFLPRQTDRRSHDKTQTQKLFSLGREALVGAVKNCEPRSWRISIAESHYQEKSSGECNRLRTLVWVR